jgi:hypothetical protein
MNKSRVAEIAWKLWVLAVAALGVCAVLWFAAQEAWTTFVEGWRLLVASRTGVIVICAVFSLMVAALVAAFVIEKRIQAGKATW